MHGLVQEGSQPGSPNKAAGSSSAAGHGEEEGDKLTLADLDDEIAHVDADLRVRPAVTNETDEWFICAAAASLWSKPAATL
jgi:hypothetical protein